VVEGGGAAGEGKGVCAIGTLSQSIEPSNREFVRCLQNLGIFIFK
jgi:hypothetical protein